MQSSTHYTAIKTSGSAGNTGLTDIRTDSLKVHPLNEKLYGALTADKELVESIRKTGILCPLIINDKREILSGTRRWLAAKELGLTYLPKTTVRYDPLIQEKILIESNRQRVKTSLQKLREGRELIRIEKELAKQRQATLNNRETAGGKITTSETGKSRDKAAAVVGLSGRTLEKGIAVLEAADAGDETAQEQVEKLDRGETSISAAATAVRASKEIKPKDSSVIAAIQAHEKTARELKQLLKSSGIDSDVSRSKTDGKFHVNWHEVTKEQVQKFAETFKVRTGGTDMTMTHEVERKGARA
jgi:ParB-like chromosome segregation protein Spo0J